MLCPRELPVYKLGGFLERSEHAVAQEPIQFSRVVGREGAHVGLSGDETIEGMGVKGASVQEAGSPERSMLHMDSFCLVSVALGLPHTSAHQHAFLSPVATFTLLPPPHLGGGS